jgi:ferredoxin
MEQAQGELTPLELLLKGALDSATIPLGTPPAAHPRWEGEEDSPDYDNLLACIRCGACLPVCPTYNTDLLEVQSPRGRVQLMRQVEEGLLAPSDGFLEHMYHCLDCRACQSACPTGVRIGEQVLRARVQVERTKKQHWVKKFGLDFALGDQRRLEWLMLPVALYQRIGLQTLVRKTRVLHRLPQKLKLLAFMEELLPERIPLRSLRQRIAVVVPAQGERRYRVGFFLGCVMSTVFAETSQATVRVLSENGCEVVTPKMQKCCGAPHAEEGISSRSSDSPAKISRCSSGTQWSTSSAIARPAGRRPRSTPSYCATIRSGPNGPAPSAPKCATLWSSWGRFR